MSLQSTTYPLVSVVVPAYNAETRINYSLDSIIAQDYPNIEIIVVDDASTDATVKTALRTLEGSGRPFSIITQKRNRGVSAARNTGIDAAQGDFIWFIDSDDMAEKNLVSSLYGLAEKYNCDISLCSLKDRFTDGRPDALFPVIIEGGPLHKGEDLLWLRVFKKISPTICGMLFRKQLLLATSLRFHEGCTAGEDVEFQLKALCRAKQAAVTPACLYIYMHHAEMGSIRNNNNEEKHLRRYCDNTGAHLRTAQYLSEQAPSEKIKKLADCFLLPQALIRQLTFCAKTNDRAGFEKLLSDSTTRKILSNSKEFLFQKPEIYGKAFALLHFPNLYYHIRNK